MLKITLNEVVFDKIILHQGGTRFIGHHFYLLTACGDCNPVATPKYLINRGFIELLIEICFDVRGFCFITFAIYLMFIIL